MVTGAYVAIVIRLPDDSGVAEMTRVRCPAGDNASLKFLQDMVGGYIEHLVTPDNAVDFWFNEEGKIHGLRINEVATELLWAMWPAFRGWDVLVGNVVLTGNKGPNTASVKDGLWEELQQRWQDEVRYVDETADG